MPTPTWSVGQVLTASDVNTWFVPLFAYKTANTSRANTTITADPHLIIPVAASAKYELTGLLDYEAGTTGDMKFQFTLPASATMNYTWIGVTGALSMVNNSANPAGTTTVVGGSGAGIGNGVTIQGTVTTAGTSGNMGVNWAENTSDATPTILHAESYLKLVRVG